jgi:hypothetical protein
MQYTALHRRLSTARIATPPPSLATVVLGRKGSLGRFVYVDQSIFLYSKRECTKILGPVSYRV